LGAFNKDQAVVKMVIFSVSSNDVTDIFLKWNEIGYKLQNWYESFFIFFV